MGQDILVTSGYLALGSRLKRLAERMQADAAKAHAEMGYPIQCSQFPLLAALDQFGPMSVGDAVDCLGASQPGVTRIHNSLKDLGLTELKVAADDKRSKVISLTEAGQRLVDRMRRDLWPHIDRAAADVCAGTTADTLEALDKIEAALDERSLIDRINASRAEQSFNQLEIVEYDPSLDRDFYDITHEWVDSMFALEENDFKLMENPKGEIIDRGGVILFVKAADLGIIGTCALMPVDGGAFELTKMGVRASARGRKAGEFLLAKALERAKSMGMEDLFLLTNRRCEAAIHLYEKAGFQHDKARLDQFGARYCRCDVAMSYDLAA
ncbi:GNAT family N-acetyltransferase [Henriciella sp. AS95]|uniref:bifunctional helix-turn-helix transcriptional regulator/GNAT family N-acetyltransferase n=1 Tax=Henriciella sp. AS95 TaxID=3135782 RepID=UPI003179B217